MDIGPRQLSFIKEEMKSVKEDPSRRPTEQVEAERIENKIETVLTE